MSFSKGPSINDVSSEGEGGGPPSKPIYYISLFSNLSQQGEGGGVINSRKWADVVHGWPHGGVEFSSNQRLSQVLPALLQNEIEEDELGILKCEQHNGAKFVLKQHSSPN